MLNTSLIVHILQDIMWMMLKTEGWSSSIQANLSLHLFFRLLISVVVYYNEHRMNIELSTYTEYLVFLCNTGKNYILIVILLLVFECHFCTPPWLHAGQCHYIVGVDENPNQSTTLWIIMYAVL